METPAEEQRFLAAEHEVELHSAELKKELRLGDLVLTQIVYIIGLTYVGTAAKVGPPHLLFWLPAVLLFFVPSAMVVLHLNREMPLEGGIYQWAKLRFGGLIGFLVACNLWATMVLLLSAHVSGVVANLAYAMGPSGTWIRESNLATFTVGFLLIGGLVLVSARGLVVGKWIHNAGAFASLIIIAAMGALALPRWARGGAVVAPVVLSPPAATLLNLNLLGKMAFGAFGGFDGAAIFSGECRDPHVAGVIRRSIWLAAPMITAIYVLGTAFVLVFTRPDSVDLIAPTTQALTSGAPGTVVAPFAAILLIVQIIGFSAVTYNAVTRLPMVAGWDHLLPGWLSRLHPRYKTPVGSIGLIGIVTLGVTILGNLGTGSQEAFQLFLNAGIICWALTYLVMFAIPLAARGEKPRWSLRLAAASGFLMTLLFTVLSIFPIIEVKDAASFTAKVSGVIIGINAIGAAYFFYAQRISRPAGE